MFRLLLTLLLLSSSLMAVLGTVGTTSGINTTNPEVVGDERAHLCHALLTPCVAGQPCGDLTVDGPRVASSAHIATLQLDADNCAVVEGCATAGLRTVIRFDMATPNVGDADIFIGNAGAPSLKNCFEWSPCHAHYHFQGFAQYYLSKNGVVVAKGHKSSSCLQDALRTPNATQLVKQTADLFTCRVQGISAGYQDVYGSHLDCQVRQATTTSPNQAAHGIVQ